MHRGRHLLPAAAAAPGEVSECRFPVFDEFEELSERTERSGETPQLSSPMGVPMEFLKLYDTSSSSSKGDSEVFALVSKRVLDSVFQEKKARFDQEKLLRRLEDTALVLWPAQGTKGWDAYAKLAGEREGSMAASERVVFTCEMTISFEPFHMAMLEPLEHTSFGDAPSAGKMLHGKRGAHDPVHDTITRSFAGMSGE